MVLLDFLLSADRFLFKSGLRKTEVYGGSPADKFRCSRSDWSDVCKMGIRDFLRAL